ncbi:hypothetical protein [Mycobacterium marinum]|uniref:hypothetical protein n=1 Tax=Mycobacterium marinum TaxID=1781 RepID=UPI0021C47296|nr:hypothetical protein [Mycobacterium marinum]
MCSVDWKLVISALAAFGSISAALAALYIATSDRRDRKREREAADEAQARLVVVNVGIPWHYGMKPHEFPIQCTNFSAAAVLDVKLESARMRAFSHARPTLSGYVQQVLSNDGKLASFNTSWVDATKEPFPSDAGQGVADVDIEAYVSFEDARGNRWRKANTGALERLRR